MTVTINLFTFTLRKFKGLTKMASDTSLIIPSLNLNIDFTRFIEVMHKLISSEERKWIKIQFRIPAPKHLLYQIVIALNKHVKIISIVSGYMKHCYNRLGMLPNSNFFKSVFQFFVHRRLK